MESPRKQELENIIFGTAFIVVFYGLISLVFSVIDWVSGSNLLWQPLPVSFLNHDKTAPPLVWMCLWALLLGVFLSLRQTLVTAHRKKIARLKKKFLIEERERNALEAER